MRWYEKELTIDGVGGTKHYWGDGSGGERPYKTTWRVYARDSQGRRFIKHFKFPPDLTEGETIVVRRWLNGWKSSV